MDADPQVTAYLAGVGAPDRATLGPWRALCQALPEGFPEEFRYAMACSTRADQPELGFARQKRQLSLYVLRTDVMETHREQLSGYSVGKGCVRFPLGRPADPDLVASLIRATGASDGPVC